MFKTLLVCLVLLVIGGASGAYKLIPLYEDYKSQIEEWWKTVRWIRSVAGGKLYL